MREISSHVSSVTVIYYSLFCLFFSKLRVLSYLSDFANGWELSFVFSFLLWYFVLNTWNIETFVSQMKFDYCYAFGNGRYLKMELDFRITYLTETKDLNIFRFYSEKIIKFWNWLIFVVHNYWWDLILVIVLATKHNLIIVFICYYIVLPGNKWWLRRSRVAWRLGLPTTYFLAKMDRDFLYIHHHI